MKEADSQGKGFPDMSFHGERAWFCNMENTSRMIGMMLCGERPGADGKNADDFIYVGYNFHWEVRKIALPNLPEGMQWKKVMDTGDLSGDGFYEDGPVYTREVEMGPRTVSVLMGVPVKQEKKSTKHSHGVKKVAEEKCENSDRRVSEDASVASL